MATLTAAVNADMATLTAAVNADMATLTGRINGLEHSLSTVRTLTLLRNGSCTEPESPLLPVPNRHNGTMPPTMFPRTIQDFWGFVHSK
ncbi:hypothetical protein Ndes2526B_g04074 [Nannochloris sp. 'desiccata']